MIISIYNTPTNEQASEIRKIAKSFGVKKCKKSAHYIYVGSQIERVETSIAHKMMDAIKAAGYHIDCESTTRELADKGLFDVCMVAKIVEQEIKLVLPEHKESDLRSPVYGYDRGWNDCLDNIHHLNK